MSVLKFESNNNYNVLKLKTSDLASSNERLPLTLSLSKNISKKKPENLETINEYSEKGVDSDINSSPMGCGDKDKDKDRDNSFEFEFDEDKKNNPLEICEIIACKLDIHKCGIIYLNDIVNDLNSTFFYYSQIKSISDFLHSYFNKTRRVIIEVPYFIDKLYMAYCLKKFNLKNSLDLGIKQNLEKNIFQKTCKIDKRRYTVEKFVIKDNKMKDTYEYLDSIDKKVQKHSDQKKKTDELSSKKKSETIPKKITCFSKNLIKDQAHSTNFQKLKESKKSKNSSIINDSSIVSTKCCQIANSNVNANANSNINLNVNLNGEKIRNHKIKVKLFNLNTSRKSVKSPNQSDRIQNFFHSGSCSQLGKSFLRYLNNKYQTDQSNYLRRSGSISLDKVPSNFRESFNFSRRYSESGNAMDRQVNNKNHISNLSKEFTSQLKEDIKINIKNSNSIENQNTIKNPNTKNNILSSFSNVRKSKFVRPKIYSLRQNSIKSQKLLKLKNASSEMLKSNPPTKSSIKKK